MTFDIRNAEMNKQEMDGFVIFRKPPDSFVSMHSRVFIMRQKVLTNIYEFLNSLLLRWANIKGQGKSGLNCTDSQATMYAFFILHAKRCQNSRAKLQKPSKLGHH